MNLLFMEKQAAFAGIELQPDWTLMFESLSSIQSCVNDCKEQLPLTNSPGPAATMTAYIPSLTFPPQIFATPAASILLPIALGTGVGFAVSRTFTPSPPPYFRSLN